MHPYIYLIKETLMSLTANNGVKTRTETKPSVTEDMSLLPKTADFFVTSKRMRRGNAY